MTDIVSPEVRSRMMSGIRGTNTKPEMLIRRGLHALGLRYRLHASDLPGKPDLVFRGRRAVIFIHGCFWHGHDCSLFRWPSTRTEFWHTKIGGNIVRDRKVRQQLLDQGWRICEIWECTMKGRNRRPVETILGQCVAFLDGDAVLEVIGGDQTVTVSDDA